MWFDQRKAFVYEFSGYHTVFYFWISKKDQYGKLRIVWKTFGLETILIDFYFQSLGPNHPEKQEVTCENSKTEVNRAKNRYQDIVACKLIIVFLTQQKKKSQF